MFAGKKRMGQRGRGKGLVCMSVLRVCFVVSVLVVKGGIRYTLVVCSIKTVKVTEHIYAPDQGPKLPN